MRKIEILETLIGDDKGDIVIPVELDYRGNVYYYDKLNRYCCLQGKTKDIYWKWIEGEDND